MAEKIKMIKDDCSLIIARRMDCKNIERGHGSQLNSSERPGRAFK
jgi:hypothetical protein